MAQRKIDVVLDSVKRLLRMGATANLVNLLHKQHPADLAQLFSELPEKDRHSSFSLLVDRNSRLAMEALSELGPEAGAALLADRSAGELAKLVEAAPAVPPRPSRRRHRQAAAGPAVGRRGGDHFLPARRAVDRGSRADSQAPG